MGVQFHGNVFRKLAVWNPERTRDEAAIAVTAAVLLRDYACAIAGAKPEFGAMVYMASPADSGPRQPVWFGPKIDAGMEQGSTFCEMRHADHDPVFILEQPNRVPCFYPEQPGPGGEAWLAEEHLRVNKLVGPLLSGVDFVFLQMAER